MKTERINLFIQLLLGGALLLGLFISAIDIYSLSGSTDDHPFWKTLHRISLTESIILVVALGATNILFLNLEKLVHRKCDMWIF